MSCGGVEMCVVEIPEGSYARAVARIPSRLRSLGLGADQRLVIGRNRLFVVGPHRPYPFCRRAFENRDRVFLASRGAVQPPDLPESEIP